MELESRTYTAQNGNETLAWYRPKSSDEDALEEVIQRNAYRRLRDKFDIKPGERWLDLGANIGAFALYCKLHGATAVCYEPDPECFSILQKNVPEFELHNEAVTNQTEPLLEFYKSKNPDNHYRNTILTVRTYQDAGTFANVHGSKLVDQEFDGVKMDIEGSEFGLIDEWLLPKTKKLVMEYHTSRDRDYRNLKWRLKILKDRFQKVVYPKVLDDYITYKGGVDVRFDQIVFCWNYA